MFLYVAILGSVFTTSILPRSYNYRILCLSAFENPGLFNSLGMFIDWGAREYVVYEWHADG